MEWVWRGHEASAGTEGRSFARCPSGSVWGQNWFVSGGVMKRCPEARRSARRYHTRYQLRTEPFRVGGDLGRAQVTRQDAPKDIPERKVTWLRMYLIPWFPKGDVLVECIARKSAYTRQGGTGGVGIDQERCSVHYCGAGNNIFEATRRPKRVKLLFNGLERELVVYKFGVRIK